MKNLADLTWKWLDGEELNQLEPKLAKRGWASLNNATSRARAAFDSEGKMVGFFVCQLFPQLGPMLVETEWWGTGVAERLANDMSTFMTDSQCRGFMVVADNPIVAYMAEAHGMRKIVSPVYVKIDRGEGV